MHSLLLANKEPQIRGDGPYHRRRELLQLHEVALAKAVLQVLGRTQALQSAAHHDAQTTAQRLTLLHAAQHQTAQPTVKVTTRPGNAKRVYRAR